MIRGNKIVFGAGDIASAVGMFGIVLFQLEEPIEVGTKPKEPYNIVNRVDIIISYEEAVGCKKRLMEMDNEGMLLVNGWAFIFPHDSQKSIDVVINWFDDLISYLMIPMCC
jgi:hypothetical protein